MSDNPHEFMNLNNIPDQQKSQEDIICEESSTNVNISGTNEVIQTKTEKKGAIVNGVLKTETTHHAVPDASGRIINSKDLPIDIEAISYTKKPIPKESHRTCAMCEIENGTTTHLYIGLDGLITSQGNALCYRCVAINNFRIKLCTYSLGIIQRPIYWKEPLWIKKKRMRN